MRRPVTPGNHSRRLGGFPCEPAQDSNRMLGRLLSSRREQERSLALAERSIPGPTRADAPPRLRSCRVVGFRCGDRGRRANQREVAERLREVADLPLPLHVVLLGE
jgi:hypothetical protein